MNTIGDIRAKMAAILERKKIDYSADMANEIKSILLKNDWNIYQLNSSFKVFSK